VSERVVNLWHIFKPLNPIGFVFLCSFFFLFFTFFSKTGQRTETKNEEGWFEFSKKGQLKL